MRYIITLLFVAFSTSIFAETKAITISGIPSNAPFYYTNSIGRPDGYIPNVAKVIMEDADLSYKFVFNNTKPMYHYNSIDERDKFINADDLYMTGVISSKKRSTFYYSIPYLTIEFYVLTRQGDLYCGLSDFAGKKLGVTKNNNSEARMLVHKDNVGSFVSDTLITFPKLSVGLKMLVDGDLDYVMVSEYCLISQQKLLNDFDVEINYANISPLEIAIVSKDKMLISKINKSITQLKSDGVFDGLLAKYVVCDSKAARERIIYTTILIAIIVILLLLSIIFIYKRIINKNVRTINRIDKNLSRAIDAGKLSIWEYSPRFQKLNVISGSTWFETVDLSTPDLQLNSVHPDDIECVKVKLAKLYSQDESKIEFTVRIKREGGDYKWTRNIIEKTVENNGYLLVGSCQDVDKQIRNEIDIKIAMAKAEESERMKSMFLANMSHEIRTPLNAIVGFSSLLLEAEEAEKDEYVNIIKVNNDILLNLINDILDLSKIDAGVSFNIEKINFPDLFKDLTRSLIFEQNNANVEFVVDTPYDTIICNIDKNRVGQIITNFVTNAIKHTTAGYIRIGYTYTNKVLELYVEDTGRGIPADKHHLVFQRFQKLDAMTRGTGLGLSIVAAIVQQMGGEYGFESTEGLGSRFWVRITPDVTNLGEIKSKKSISYRAIKRDKNKTCNNLNILVAEDIDSNYILIDRILQNHNLTHVLNGVEALNALREGSFDIVLMDIQMPVMDGIEATKEIRKFNQNIPILAVTANAFEADRVAAIEAGCNEVVTKPINKQDLIREIENLT